MSSSNKSALQQLELPFYTKYLLIAAYLASHNDAKIDKRLFVKHHGKQRKRLQNLRTNAVVREIVCFVLFIIICIVILLCNC